jgi:hypothetical protein
MSAELLQELSLPRKQPPSGRDREIYEFVMHIGASQETAAKRWGISQARVSQIVQRVEDWMHTVLGQTVGELPPGVMSDDPPLSPAERLQLAEQIAYERMEFVYGESLRAWRKSQEDSCQKRERHVKGVPVQERITRTECGKAVFLNQAMRAAQASARLLGVDTSGREQRKRAAQEVAQRNAAVVVATPSPNVSGDLKSEPSTNDVAQTTYNPGNLRDSRVTPSEAEALASLQAELLGSLPELLESAA